jgi:hypothetical protein
LKAQYPCIVYQAINIDLLLFTLSSEDQEHNLCSYQVSSISKGM